ncbi:AbrB/MazE/SpoVT family DNA-binding domain-containing protein [Planosporangium thailandense]|uniref:AbrB/MazE/SpoVT family DNA-binding domain-containing protein n=1 Tax=Planosporangium thailandense TaxID=765197 RepID=A0ABX0Y6E0_9ACTN|nr:AbrB/MazE/SpoVT family DNA-binding domain-containing protein [Planosporangium thailandense]NJC72879.1 AbrB/MazE/SpoVT family DNA-binding domain-containing protein [Planosporangium thailandense]
MTTMAEQPARRPLSAPLRERGVLTIPQSVREQLHLEAGDNLLVDVQDGRIVLTPATLVARDQAWFWTPEWQAKESESDADLAAGRSVRHTSDEAFLASLDED